MINSVFEKLINEKNLILFEKEAVLNEIFEFLKSNFNISYLKIHIKEEGDTKNIFDNSEGENHFFYTQKVRFSNNVELIFGLVFIDNKTLENIKREPCLNRILNYFSDIVYIKYLEQKVERSLVIDVLTGCYNRQYLNLTIKHIFSLAKRENHKIAFLKIGIDHFKAVLDEFNYDIGDKVIEKLAKVLKKEVRGSDLVIRISNDAFLVVLQNISEEENALLVANKLIESFKEEKVIVNESTKQFLMKTICIGIAMYPKDGLDIDTIIRKADIAIREAKNQGRGKAFIFSEEETTKIELF